MLSLKDKCESTHNTSKCRLPQTFNPENYKINLIMDFYNLKYKFFNEIDLKVIDCQSENTNEILILNSVEKFEIKNIHCLDETLNSDLFHIDYIKEQFLIPSETKCSFFYSKDLLEIANLFVFSFHGLSIYETLVKEEKCKEKAKQKIISMFLKFIQENILNLSTYKKSFLDVFCLNSDKQFDFFNYILYLSYTQGIKNNSNGEITSQCHTIIKEDSIYIKLPRGFKQGEKFKMLFEVEGGVKTQKSSAGFYLSIWGSDSRIFDMKNNQTIKTAWKEKYNCNIKDILINSVFAMAGEPVEFRNVFPCFDEPCFKSKFSMNIFIPKEDILETSSAYFHVLSNGELKSLSSVLISDKEFNKYEFTESPLMSIYLLTWVIGYYDYIYKDITIEDSNENKIENQINSLNENIIKNSTGSYNSFYNIKIRSFFPLHRINESFHSLELAEKSLQFYSSYFKIPYTFPKLDLVPAADFSFRALECWGCILFIHYALLVSPKLNLLEKKLVSRTIVHEISHMWFGNLVTMEWWDDIWLNEGFARFMEYECLNVIKPEYNLEDNFIELIFSVALKIDEKQSTHPVIGECPSPENLTDIFDTISYAKGASILRMFNHYIETWKFMEVIQEYLKFYKFKNSKTKNLWQMFKKHADIDLVEIMHSWTMKAGHPIIFVSLSDNCEDLIIEQQPYPSNLNTNSIEDEEDVIWQIPLFIKTKKYALEYKFLMKEKTMKLNLLNDLNVKKNKLLEGKDYIIVNGNMKGFYRVYYLNSENKEDSKSLLNFINKVNTGSDNTKNENSLLEDYDNIINNKNVKKNILLNSILANHKYLSSINIAGLLKDYLSIKNFSTCLHILDSIGALKDKDYLILFYAEKIYLKITKYLKPYLSFKEEFIHKEKLNSTYINTKSPLNCVTEHIKKNNRYEYSKLLLKDIPSIYDLYDYINNIMFKLIHVFVSFGILIHEKITANYPDNNQESVIENENHKNIHTFKNSEFVDEYYSIMINIISHIAKSENKLNSKLKGKCEIVIKKILQKFTSDKTSLNKNLKYAIYKVANLYSFLNTDENKKEDNVYLSILNEFSQDFFDLSLRDKRHFYSISFDLESFDCLKFFTFIKFAKLNPYIYSRYMQDSLYNTLDRFNSDNLKIFIEFKVCLFFLNYLSEDIKTMDYESLMLSSSKKYVLSDFFKYFKSNKSELIEAVLFLCKCNRIFDADLIRKVLECSFDVFRRMLLKWIDDSAENYKECEEEFQLDCINTFESHYKCNIFNETKNRKIANCIMQLINYLKSEN